MLNEVNIKKLLGDVFCTKTQQKWTLIGVRTTDIFYLFGLLINICTLCRSDIIYE